MIRFFSAGLAIFAVAACLRARTIEGTWHSGSDVDIGIPVNTLRQDLMLSLSGGPMSIGATVYGVSLAGGADGGGGFVRIESQQQVAAEPNTGMLLLAGGGLCLIAGALKRIPRRRRRDMDRDA